MEPGYGLEMEGMEEAGVTEYSRVSYLGNWMDGVLSFSKIRCVRAHFPNFLFLRVRKLNLPNVIQKVSDHWHYKPMSSGSSPTNCYVRTRTCTHTHTRIRFWICLWGTTAETI